MNNNGCLPRSFQKSLTLLALSAVSKGIKSSENTWYAGEHFKNDPTKNPGERSLHFFEKCSLSDFFAKFKKQNPELVAELPVKKKPVFKQVA